MTGPVRAAGGVLYRPAGDSPEIAVVHRPRYDDWSLPKGKLDNGEHPMAGAVREVHEETGVPGRPELRLPTVAYALPDGRPKTVDYWLMRAGAEGEVQDTDEVDRLEWLPLPAAAERLSYDDERDLLGRVAELPPITAVAGLVRHAHAGERKKWAGKDALRPLDPVGQAEAERLAELLVLLQPQRLVTAGPLRCKQTLEPLAAALDDMPIVIDNAFAEPTDADDAPAKARLAAQRMLQLVAMRDAGVPVICSQGKLLPTMLATLAGRPDTQPFKTPKGGGWLLTWSGERLLDRSRL